MTAAPLTVGELRRTLSNIPDEMPVIALYNGAEGRTEGRIIAVLRAENELPMVALVVA